MKLDKRACRHAANVPLHISLNAGVLYPILRRIWKRRRSISAAAIIANTNGMSTSA